MCNLSSSATQGLSTLTAAQYADRFLAGARSTLAARPNPSGTVRLRRGALPNHEACYARQLKWLGSW